jgi:hypothetical protein
MPTGDRLERTDQITQDSIRESQVRALAATGNRAELAADVPFLLGQINAWRSWANAITSHLDSCPVCREDGTRWCESYLHLPQRPM